MPGLSALQRWATPLCKFIPVPCLLKPRFSHHLNWNSSNACTCRAFREANTTLNVCTPHEGKGLPSWTFIHSLIWSSPFISSAQMTERKEEFFFHQWCFLRPWSQPVLHFVSSMRQKMSPDTEITTCSQNLLLEAPHWTCSAPYTRFIIPGQMVTRNISAFPFHCGGNWELV